ncbi:hypothetical protein FGO68_gene8405 [Halteria grandinella]|uniref:Uncharacterized protein n=1 Tax=Halteria grandinella TaxID=5974 RepID=A0A8J8NTV7_HALGN|nr:hypothetical protein FGO68_gene8405 [Halteria grandinella]
MSKINCSNHYIIDQEKPLISKAFKRSKEFQVFLLQQDQFQVSRGIVCILKPQKIFKCRFYFVTLNSLSTDIHDQLGIFNDQFSEGSRCLMHIDWAQANAIGIGHNFNHYVLVANPSKPKNLFRLFYSLGTLFHLY